MSLNPDKSIIEIPRYNYTIRANGVKNTVFNYTEEVLTFGGNFTGHHQAIFADKTGLNITIEHKYLAIQYRGDGHLQQPRLRLFLIDDNNNKIEINPSIYGDNVLQQKNYYNLALYPIQTITAVQFMFDSGSPFSVWEGSGRYVFYIEKVWLTNTPFDLRE